VKGSDDLKSLVNAEPNMMTDIIGAEEILSAVIACVAGLGFVIPAKSRSFAPFFYRCLGINREDLAPQVQDNALRFVCQRPRLFEVDTPLLTVSVRFNPLDWQTTPGPALF
jgi:hypothetical protein